MVSVFPVDAVNGEMIQFSQLNRHASVPVKVHATPGGSFILDNCYNVD